MNKIFTVGISTRALFDLEKEHQIFQEEGVKAYVDYQILHEKDVLEPGAAFSLVQSFLALNQGGQDLIEVVIMSKNSADVSLRIFHSIEHYGLDIKKAALTTGAPIAPYLKAFGVDLYLSYDAAEVSRAIASGIAAGVLLQHDNKRMAGGRVPLTDRRFACQALPLPMEQIRIAFDGDAVLFGAEAEEVFWQEGLEAFCQQEKEKAQEPLEPGPFAHVLLLIAEIQKRWAQMGWDANCIPIRTALVTARSAPAHERVIRTLQSWGVRIDEAFFMGGMDKSGALSAFGAHIFFDDNEENTKSASQVVLAVRVPRLEEFACVQIMEL